MGRHEIYSKKQYKEIGARTSARCKMSGICSKDEQGHHGRGKPSKAHLGRLHLPGRRSWGRVIAVKTAKISSRPPEVLKQPV